LSRVKTLMSIQMSAPSVVSPQDYLTKRKREIVSRMFSVEPQPAFRRYNYVYTSVVANRANQVIKNVSVPQKSCVGGWSITSGCCTSA